MQFLGGERLKAFIDLPDTLSLASITWEADTSPGTSIAVRTRTGDELTVGEVRYFDKNGTQVHEATWNGLLRSYRGRIDTVWTQGDDWSAWSEWNRLSGKAFRSPNPREMLQVQIVFASKDPELMPILHKIYPPLCSSAK